MRRILQTLLLAIGCIGGSAVAQPAPSPAPEPVPAPAIQETRPEILDLGNQRYRIGEIEIDKASAEFRVSGQVLRDAPPLEFLVVTRGGHKAYESVLEVNADAFQFNLACILIGLDGSLAKPQDQRDVNQPATGDPVEVTVRWTVDGKTQTARGSDLLALGEPPQAVAADEWVYTGSEMLADGRYLADLSGALLGFVHRGEGIIEHRQGVGIGNYGAVVVNRAVTPPVGTAVELIIRKPTSGK